MYSHFSDELFQFIETLIHECVHLEEEADGITILTHNDTDTSSDYSFISRYRR